MTPALKTPKNSSLPVRLARFDAETQSLGPPLYLDDYPLARSIFQILDGFLRAPGQPGTVAASLAAALLPIFDTFEHVVHVRYLWGVILDLLKQLALEDERQALLIEVLLLLREETPPAGAVRIEYEALWPHTHFWKMLPDWRAVWSDFEPDAPVFSPYEDRRAHVARWPDGVLPGPWRAALSGPEWTNLNSFVARLHSAAPELRLLDVVGLRAMLEALEEIQPTHVLENVLPAAVCWIIYAGCRLKGNKIPYAQWEDTSETKHLPWSVGKLYEGRGLKHFCPERWEFWRARFVVMRDREDLNAATRAYAAKAVEEIERLDGIESFA